MRKILKRIAYFFLFIFILLNIICASQAYYFTRFYDNIKVTAPQEMGILTMLLGQQFPKSIVVDSLKIPHSNISITTEDGLKLAAWNVQHQPTDTLKAKGTIIMFHGHGSSRSGVIMEAGSFYNMGWNIFMVDFRAHGQSEGTECSIGYYESKDVKAAYDYIAASGEKSIVLWGISLGAATITKAINDYPSVQPKKIMLEMPFGTMLGAVEGRVRTMNLPDEPIGVLLTFWGGAELGVWAYSNKPQEYAKKITCPVLLQWGKIDPRVSEKETDAIYTNLAAKEKKVIKYDGIGHESICKNAHEKWVQNVSAFLK